MIDLNKLFDKSFNEWMMTIDDAHKGRRADSPAHVETLLKNYHLALKEELEKQNIHI